MNARSRRGEEIIAKLDPGQLSAMIAAIGGVAPDMPRLIRDFAFGEIYARPGLDLKSRQLATVAGLAALGAPPQLKAHIKAALNVGWRREEIVEALMQMALYAGFPAALNALVAAKDAFAELDKPHGRKASR
jgi:4-carboxymuconolactone decarboxylase